MALDRELQELKDQLSAFESKLDSLGNADRQRDALKTKSAGENLINKNQNPFGILRADEKMEAADRLKDYSVPQLQKLLALQLNKDGIGIPVSTYADAGAMNKLYNEPDVTKALDVSGATPLIRQDLEPILYQIFVKEFPFWDRIKKKPANGLTHAYNRHTAYGSAEWMAELDTATDSQGTYARATTNVAILGTRRGISLKAKFAVQHGGMPYQPEAEEIKSGVRSIVYLWQKGFFQGNASDNASAGASTEKGAYDVDSFDGLRILTPSGNRYTKATSESFVEALNSVCTTLINNGGRPNVLAMRVGEHAAIMNEQLANQRWVDKTDLIPGVSVPALTTVAGNLPVVAVPGDSIGTYAISGTTYGDIYVIDEDGLAAVWLGSDSPTVLDIPIGTNGVLQHLYIVFMMSGLEFAAPEFTGKVRVQQ